MKTWFVYMLRCVDNTFYIGISDDLEKRVSAHNSAKGAKYTRGRLPVQLIYHEQVADRSTALKREIALKKLSRKQKEELIETFGKNLI